MDDRVDTGTGFQWTFSMSIRVQCKAELPEALDAIDTSHLVLQAELGLLLQPRCPLEQVRTSCFAEIGKGLCWEKKETSATQFNFRKEYLCAE